MENALKSWEDEASRESLIARCKHLEKLVHEHERSAEKMASQLEKRAPLNELDVRHIVATEMARVMLSHVLVSENSQVVARAREMQVELGKLNSVCHELDKQRKEAIEQRDKWKSDGQQWAADYLKLARMLGVPDTVRDRSVVAEAERIAQTEGASTMKLAVESVQHVVIELVRGLSQAGPMLSTGNMLALLEKRFAELAAGGA